jgi:hypothetical protein
MQGNTIVIFLIFIISQFIMDCNNNLFKIFSLVFKLFIYIIEPNLELNCIFFFRMRVELKDRK